MDVFGGLSLDTKGASTLDEEFIVSSLFRNIVHLKSQAIAPGRINTLLAHLYAHNHAFDVKMVLLAPTNIMRLT